jgi:AcrR family transcriptional regulator
MKVTRPYHMTARAEAAAQTASKIIDAAAGLFSTRDFDDVTLGAIAEAAGVTLQTVLRRFGDKEQLINAAAEIRGPEIGRSRRIAVPGDVGAAVRALVASYESMGDLNWRLLRQAHRFPVLQRLLDGGRATHRRWIEESFAPLLPSRGRARERRLLQLFAATDFYQWKLLRIDLGLPREEVEQLIRETIEAIAREES